MIRMITLASDLFYLWNIRSLGHALYHRSKYKSITEIMLEMIWLCVYCIISCMISIYKNLIFLSLFFLYFLFFKLLFDSAEKKALLTSVYLVLMQVIAKIFIHVVFAEHGWLEKMKGRPAVPIEMYRIILSNLLVCLFIKIYILIYKFLLNRYNNRFQKIETKKLFIEADRLDHHLYFSDWLEAVLIPCMSMVVIGAFFMDNTRCRIVWMTMAVYSINLMAQDLYMRTRNERSSTVFVWNIQRQAEQYRAYCHSLGEAWERNRRFRHDLKKQYMLERIYLERGEYEKLEQEYDRVIQITSSREVISGHVMTDAILSCKRSEADQRQIGLTVETSIPTDLAISDYHLNMLLGNILDNAIRHTGQGGQIWIKMVYDRQNLLIHCKNTVDECENRSTDSGSSDGRGEPFVPGIKNGVANSEMHGIGLHIMREIVAYYNGTMDIKKTNCEYIVMIILELTYQKLH